MKEQLTLLEENILSEAKADNDKLIAHVGQKEFDRFISLKDRLKGEEKDLYYWLKKEPRELIDKLDSIEQTKTRSQKDTEAKQGAELIAENDYYKVYKINTFEAAKKYGANTKWCITGKESGWDPGENENKYWKQYTDAGIEFYFYISKDDKHKYAIASHPNKRDRLEIFDEKDNKVNEIPKGPDVTGVYSSPYDENGLKIKDNILSKARKSVVNVEIPDDVTSIGTAAFINCASLTSVTIGNSVESIGASAFSDCKSLPSVTIGCNVKSIGGAAFDGCTSLTSVIFGENSRLTSIGDFVFSNCTSLTNIVIPDSVKSIGWGTFYYCESLVNITIPDSVTSIGKSAFSSCTKLTNINYRGTKAQWNAINKGYDWDLITGNYTIHCTDGDIKKEANESMKRQLTLNEDFGQEEVIEINKPTETEVKNTLIDFMGNLVKAQWDIIAQYNSVIASIEAVEQEVGNDFGKYISSLKELVTDETANIGILEGIVQDIEPELLIDQGKEEIEQKLDIEVEE